MISGRGSGRLLPERGKGGVDVGLQDWACWVVLRACPLQAWSQCRDSSGGMGCGNVRVEGAGNRAASTSRSV